MTALGRPLGGVDGGGVARTTRRALARLGATGPAIAGVWGGAGAALLAACGPREGTGAQPAGPAQLSGTLHFMDWELGTGPAQERWAKVVSQFKERYPGITIEEDRSNLFWQKLPAVVAAGTPPDTANLRRQAEFPALVGRGTVRALEPYLSKSKVLNKADFYERTVAMNSLEGKLYALPNTLNLYVLYYNKSHFLERGLKFPDTTWDYATDFDEAVQRLTKREGERIVQAGMVIPSWWPGHYLGNKDISQWQGGLTDKGTCARVNYDRQEVIEGYEWYQKHLCRLRTAEPEGPNRVTSFEAGTASISLSFIQISTYNDKIGKQFEWDITLPPLGDKQKPRVVTMIGGGASIFNESKNPDVAWAFIEFLNDPQYMLEQVRAEGALSIYANRKIMESKEYQSSPLPPSDKRLFIKGLEAGRFFAEASWEMRAMGVEPPPTDMAKIFDCSGAPKEVLPPAAVAINGALKQAGAGCP
jgi:multiple sugar transport system substrate-binding protein